MASSTSSDLTSLSPSATSSSSMSSTSSTIIATATSLNEALKVGGRGQTTNAQTIGQFVASLSAAIIIFAVQVTVFLLLKNKLRRLYSPRTYLVPEIERFPPPPTGLLSWTRPVFKTSDKEFIQKSGLDAFFFVRYLFMLLKIFVPLACVILPILLPINQVGGRGSQYAVGKFNETANNVTGLDQLSWVNVRPEDAHRYWAHCVLAVGVILFCCYIFYNELLFYVRVRQDYLTTPQHRIRASATSVLIRTIPQELLKEETLRQMFDVFPGGVKNIWINRDYEKLADKTKLALKLSEELELSEMNLIMKCRQAHQKKLKKMAKEGKGGASPVSTTDSERRHGENDKPLWTEYASEKDRDTMRLPMFGWYWVWTLPSFLRFGKKVDTIDFCRTEVARLNVEIAEEQANPEKFPLMNSAFIQFNNQEAAHMACQAVSHDMPKQMTPRILEIDPNDVIWDNMSMKWWEQYLRTAAVLVVVVAMIVGWAIPVTFASLVSNISYLQKFAFLSWIGKMPAWLRSAIQGILSPALLAALLALLPVLLRLLSRFQGIETGMGVELSVQNYYFAFLFVQLFLVVSIASGISSVVKELADNVTNTPGLLASNLPRASNFFLSYMILQGMSVSAGALLQIGALIGLFVLGKLLDTTARQKWKRETNLPQIQWGSFFPVYTNLACIGLIYSVISPVILILLCITFSLFWIAFRYNTIFVFRFRVDTGGLVFPKAINQLFTGLYVMELCLIGLFFLVRDHNNEPVCFPQGIIMIIATAFTVIYQILLNRAFAPLFKFLPISMTLQNRFGRADEIAQPLTTSSPQDDDDEEHHRPATTSAPAPPITKTTPSSRAEKDVEAALPSSPLPPALPAKDTAQSSIHPALRPLAPVQAIAGLAKGTLDASRGATRDLTRGVAGAGKSTLTAATNMAAVQAERQLASQRRSLKRGAALFNGLADEIEDLEPEERDVLVRRAFLHEALRARRPVAWIPRDELGVADDEVLQAQRVSKEVWVSDEGCVVDERGAVRYTRSPPDFDELDIIRL